MDDKEIEKLVDEIILAESKENYEGQIKALAKIAESFGYEVTMTGDGNWLLDKQHPYFRVLFDSTRGNHLHIEWSEGAEEKDEIVECKLRDIVEKCIKYMNTH